jgi:hypothetical protein
MSEPTQQSSRKAVFTNTTTMYDTDNSAVKLGYVDHKAYLDFSPVLQSMIGKTPAKGESKYDHKNGKVMFTLDYANICLIQKQIELLEDGKLNQALIDTETKTFNLYGKGEFENYDCFSMSVINKATEAEICFFFTEKELVAGVRVVEGKAKNLKVKLTPEWTLFKEFINSAALLNATGFVEHGARMAGGGYGGARTENTGPVGNPNLKKRSSGIGGVIGNGTAPKTSTAEAEDYFDEEFEDADV